MFNRTIVQAPRGPSTVVHHEHRAPTDDSVRILSEMERAAEARIIETIRLDSNDFKAVLHLMREQISRGVRSKCVFDMNGKRIVVEEFASDDDTYENRNALIEKTLAKAAERIAAELLIPSFNTLLGKRPL